MPGTYTYDPGQIAFYGKDRMRFELGDVMVEGKEKTCALSDDEYIALIGNINSEKGWMKAKLKCFESISRRFSFEPDTKVGPASFGFGDRAKLWREEYEKLKKDLKVSAVSPGAILMKAGDMRIQHSPYFYNGMMSYRESEGEDI